MHIRRPSSIKSQILPEVRLTHHDTKRGTHNADIQMEQDQTFSC